MRTKYFDSTGHEVDERIALDRGVLRSGFSQSTSMTMKDSNFTRGARIVDGSGNSGLALHRPGYRIPVMNDRRAVVHDSYAKADKQAGNRWKCQDNETLCPDCDGEGYDEDGTVCSTCNGEGVMPERESTSKGGGFGNGNDGGFGDRRSVDTATRDQAYRDYDSEIQRAYRNDG